MLHLLLQKKILKESKRKPKSQEKEDIFLYQVFLLIE